MSALVELCLTLASLSCLACFSTTTASVTRTISVGDGLRFTAHSHSLQ